MAMVVVDDSCLKQADSQPKSCGLVWGSTAAWRCSTFTRWTKWTLAMTWSWWQHYKYRLGYYYYYYSFTHSLIRSLTHSFIHSSKLNEVNLEVSKRLNQWNHNELVSLGYLLQLLNFSHAAHTQTIVDNYIHTEPCYTVCGS